MRGYLVRSMVCKIKIVALLGCFFWLQHTMNQAYAQYFTGPRAASLGGAGVAAAQAGETIFINPSILPLLSDFEASLHYQDGYLANHNHRTHYGVSLADNSEGVVAAGAVSYLKGSRTFTGGLGSDEQYWNVALGGPVNRQLFFGLNLIYLDSRVSEVGSYEQWDGSVAFLYILNPFFTVGGAYQQMARPGSEVPEVIRLAPTSRLGIQYIPTPFLKALLDVSRQEAWNPDKEGAIHLGVETIINEFSILRVGGRWDDLAKRNYVTAGWGFDGPKLKINYSFEKPLKDSNGALHGVDFRVSF